MNRDQNKDRHYFTTYVEKAKQRVIKFENWIATGKTPEARIPIVQRNIGAIKLRALVAKYSSGDRVPDIESDYLELLRTFDSYWLAGQVLMGAEGRKPKQYLDYDDMLWMLSFGCIFKAPNQDFALLAKLIDRDQVVDPIYEFLLSAKINREPKNLERHNFGWKLYKTLTEATSDGLAEKDRIGLLSKFLPVEWESDHKEMLSALKSQHEIYYGAWSFESAALVCILNLDDRPIEDNQYYPKDLVEHHRLLGSG